MSRLRSPDDSGSSRLPVFHKYFNPYRRSGLRPTTVEYFQTFESRAPSSSLLVNQRRTWRRWGSSTHPSPVERNWSVTHGARPPFHRANLATRLWSFSTSLGRTRDTPLPLGVLGPSSSVPSSFPRRLRGRTTPPKPSAPLHGFELVPSHRPHILRASTEQSLLGSFTTPLFSSNITRSPLAR